MTTPTPTPNLKLQPIEANRRTWADIMNRNLRMIDATVGTYFSVQNLQGVWQNSTLYSAGQAVIDEDTSIVYITSVTHTSANLPSTFEEDRTAFPEYWSVYSSPARARGVWLPETSYALNDFVVSGAQYAIAVEAHVSGDTFSVDASAGKWAILVDLSAVGSTTLPVPGGVADANKFVAMNSLGSGYNIYSQAEALALLGVSETGLLLFQAASAAAARTAIGAQESGSYQPLDAVLTTLTGFTLGAFADNLLATTDAAAVRTLLALTSLATLTPGAGVTTFLATPSSANLAAMVTDETGTGNLLFSVSPAMTGNPTAPTQAEWTGNTRLASTAYADRTAKVLQTRIFQTASYDTTAGTALPFDDSIPQITEGDEVLALSFTPVSASSRLFVEVLWNGSRGNTDHVGLAIFEDATADARGANWGYIPAPHVMIQLRTYADYAPGSIAEIDFTVRVGGNTGAALYTNGIAANRIGGGRVRSYIRVTEYLPV